MRRLFTVAVLTACSVLIPGAAALACEGHYDSEATATILLAANPVYLAGLLGAGVIAGLVHLARR